MNNKAVHIEAPCPMAMFRLRQSDGALHCSSCKKAIVDFTECSDEEIIAQFQPGMCGVFTDDQIQTPQFDFLYKTKFVLLSLLSVIGFNVTPMNAQTHSNQPARTAEVKKRTSDYEKTYKTDPKPATTKSPAKASRRKKHLKGKYVPRTLGCPSF